MLYFDIYPEVAIDFVYENAVDDLNNTRVDAEELMMQAVQEADVLLSAILELDNVAEATVTGSAAKAVGGAAKVGSAPVKGVKKVASKAKELVNRIIQFIKDLFARLVDTMQTWFQNSGKWLEARKGAFANFKYDDLSIDMIPYWEGTKSNPIQRTSRSLLQFITDAFKQNGVDQKEFDFEVFAQNRLKYLMDQSGDLTEGMKNFYRVGVAQGKDRVSLGGANLRARVNNDFIPMILNYDTYIKEAQNVQRTLDNRTTALALEYDKRGVALESALFDLPYNETLFATFEQFDVLLEADANNQKTNEAGSSASDRTKVKVGRDVRSEDQKTDDTSDREAFNSKLSSKNNGEIRVLNNILRAEKLMMSCYLTVMQERYSAYMNALKAIWSAANNEGGRNKDVNGEGKQVGKDKK